MTMNTTKGGLDRVEADRDEATRAIETLDGLLASMRRRVASLEKANRGLSNELGERAKRIAGLEAELSTTRQPLTLERERAFDRSRIAELEATLRATEEESKKRGRRIVELETERVELRRSNAGAAGPALFFAFDARSQVAASRKLAESVARAGFREYRTRLDRGEGDRGFRWAADPEASAEYLVELALASASRAFELDGAAEAAADNEDDLDAEDAFGLRHGSIHKNERARRVAVSIRKEGGRHGSPQE